MDKQEYFDKYNLLTSQEYIDFTQRFVVEFAREIKEKFPDIEFTLKIRLKSPKSYEKKVNKYSGDKDDKDIEDIIGIRLIIRRVPFNYTKDNLYGFEGEIIPNRNEDREKFALYDELRALLGDLFEERYSLRSRRSLLRIRVSELVEEYTQKKEDENVARDKYEKLKEEFKKEEESLSSQEICSIVKEKNRIILKEQLHQIELVHELVESKKKELKMAIEDLTNTKENYSLTKGRLYQACARRIIEYLMINSEVLKGKKFGIEKIEGSDEEKRGGKSGKYRAYHYSIKSNVCDGWEGEVQGLSERNHQIATIGDAAHDKSKEKTRYLPDWGKSIEERKVFLEKVKPILPRTMLYVDEGKIYECSDLENFFEYYYNLLMLKNKEEKGKTEITDKMIDILIGTGVNVEDILKIKENQGCSSVLPYEARQVREMLDFIGKYGEEGRFIDLKEENDSKDAPSL